MKKISMSIAILVILTLTAPSCADDSQVVTQSTIEAVQTEIDSESDRMSVSDMLPDTDWDGREFRIIATDYLADDFIAEEETGALINDAVYSRNRMIEETMLTASRALL